MLTTHPITLANDAVPLMPLQRNSILTASSAITLQIFSYLRLNDLNHLGITCRELYRQVATSPLYIRILEKAGFPNVDVIKMMTPNLFDVPRINKTSCWTALCCCFQKVSDQSEQATPATLVSRQIRKQEINTLLGICDVLANPKHGMMNAYERKIGSKLFKACLKQYRKSSKTKEIIRTQNPIKIEQLINLARVSCQLGYIIYADTRFGDWLTLHLKLPPTETVDLLRYWSREQLTRGHEDYIDWKGLDEDHVIQARCSGLSQSIKENRYPQHSILRQLFLLRLQEKYSKTSMTDSQALDICYTILSQDPRNVEAQLHRIRLLKATENPIDFKRHAEMEFYYLQHIANTNIAIVCGPTASPVEFELVYDIKSPPPAFLKWTAKWLMGCMLKDHDVLPLIKRGDPLSQEKGRQLADQLFEEIFHHPDLSWELKLAATIQLAGFDSHVQIHEIFKYWTTIEENKSLPPTPRAYAACMLLYLGWAGYFVFQLNSQAPLRKRIFGIVPPLQLAYHGREFHSKLHEKISDLSEYFIWGDVSTGHYYSVHNLERLISSAEYPILASYIKCCLTLDGRANFPMTRHEIITHLKEFIQENKAPPLTAEAQYRLANLYDPGDVSDLDLIDVKSLLQSVLKAPWARQETRIKALDRLTKYGFSSF